MGPVCAITQTSLKGSSASLTNLSARDLVDFSVMVSEKIFSILIYPKFSLRDKRKTGNTVI